MIKLFLKTVNISVEHRIPGYSNIHNLVFSKNIKVPFWWSFKTTANKFLSWVNSDSIYDVPGRYRYICGEWNNRGIFSGDIITVNAYMFNVTSRSSLE